MQVVSFGSLNYDMSIWLDRLPNPDETLRATKMQTFCGGKGANQATAAARLGAEAYLVGCVGNDDRGDWLLEMLTASKVNISHVRRVAEPTGTAVPLITPEDVSIVVASGANASTNVDDAEAASELIATSDVLLIQGEAAAAGARRAAQIARKAATTVLVNPAPVDPFLIEAVVPLADVLVVNRVEQAQIKAIGLDTSGCQTILTLGSGGAQVNDVVVPPFPITTVDQTGAGDAFCGALGVAIAEGTTILDAVRFANAAGALASSQAGAQPSMPTRQAVQALLSRGNS
ncbi:MAG: ribokinase [Acidimicrobiia bacterium]|nr:ribokinase [Acidimicrobiia bacterium]MYC58159.1 ribokinase [Acidimicrobiia bacterium]MYG94354.1 ribokinase [Acidimicrobiia bacterium]MYI30591.1 ribokinase [Acidimicrobiia bacterium]